MTDDQPAGPNIPTSYGEYIPAANEPLHGLVQRMAHMHFLQPLPPERLAPDSFIKLSFIMEGKLHYFDGQGQAFDQHDGITGHVPPRRGIIATSDGPVRCMMVNFFPSAFHRVFGGPADRFNGMMVPPDRLFGDRIGTLYQEIRATRDPQLALDVVQRFLIDLLPAHSTAAISPIEHLEHHIRERKGTVPVSELAALAGLSERQLQRRFKVEIGLSPKAFCQVVRFNHVYGEMKRNGTLDLDLALACGYFDESHMMKDLVYFLGKNPKRSLSLIRPMVDRDLGH